MFAGKDRLFELSRAELLHCWEASRSSEEAFRRRYKRDDIARMCIPRDCDIIRVQIQKEIESGKRTNINICSQLLHGVTKILSYQADDELEAAMKLFEATTLKSSHVRKERRGHPNVTSEVIEAEDLQNDYILSKPGDVNFNPRTDLHLLLDEVPPIPNYEETELNELARVDFGMLTEAEFDVLFNSSLTELGEEVRHDETTVAEKSSHILKNVTEHTVEFEDNEQTSAVGAQLEQLPEQEVPPLEAIDPPAEVTESHADIAIPVISVQEVQDQEISPEVPEQSVFHKPKPLARKKSRALIDKAIKLSGNILQKQTQDCYIYTAPFSKVSVQEKLANDPFGRPSNHLVVGGTWGKLLTLRFKEIIAKAIMPPPEFADATTGIDADDAEIMRQGQRETSPENVQESLTAIKAGQQTDFSMSKVPHSSTMITLPLQEVAEDSRKEVDDEPNFDVPQIPDITDSPVLMKHRKQITINECAENDLLEAIELYQRKQDPVPFNKMAHELNYDKQIATDQFLNLLKLHSVGHVILRQAEQFGEIWITYLPNSSGGSQTTR